jgi:hypothetical protein
MTPSEVDDAIKLTRQRQVGGDHYKALGVEPWEIIQKNGLDYWEGNALKYLLRWRKKAGAQDLRKAIHYIEYLIAREEGKPCEST